MDAKQRRWLIFLTLVFVVSLFSLYRITVPQAPLMSGLFAERAPAASQDPSLAHLLPAEATATSRAETQQYWFGSSTARLGEETGPSSTPTAYFSFLPYIEYSIATKETPVLKVEPPAVSPTPNWPNGLSRPTNSKLSLHVVQNNDAFIMEFVRRVRPRVIKSVGDLGWLKDVKAVSPNTVTIGRLMGQDETWPETKHPEDAAAEYIASQIERYRLNPGVDYWEGWNEFVPVTTARFRWYAAFEAARACQMQALGLRAAVGGFTGGTPEYSEMALFLPALEAAHRCGGIFTLHEAVSPLVGCGIFTNKAGIIPGAPSLGDVSSGYMMLRYRFWYEGYLKPIGLGDLPLVISELTMGGTVPGQSCNGPGGPSWKDYGEWWLQQGVGPNGAQSYVNLLAWYDSEIRKDPYVIGTTIFTAGAPDPGSWHSEDLHDVMIPLAYYMVEQ